MLHSIHIGKSQSTANLVKEFENFQREKETDTELDTDIYSSSFMVIIY